MSVRNLVLPSCRKQNPDHSNNHGNDGRILFQTDFPSASAQHSFVDGLDGSMGESFLVASSPVNAASPLNNGWEPSVPHRRRRLMCAHAMANGNSVLGVARNLNLQEGCSYENDEDWIAWNTSIRSDCAISSVASNSDGTVIAVANDFGVVHLLRGVDGAIIASRRIADAAAGNRAVNPLDVSFVAGKSSPEVPDVLVIVPVMGGLAVDHENDVDTNPPIQITMVSGIDGEQLNSADAIAVAAAARTLSIHMAELVLPPLFSANITNVCAAFLAHDSLRFFGVDESGIFFSVDYSLEEAQFITAPSRINLRWRGDSNDDNDKENGATFCRNTGLHVDDLSLRTSLLVLSMTSNDSNKLFWLDCKTARQVGEYEVLTNLPHSQLLSIHPLSSFNAESTISLAVAAGTKSRSKIQVIQAMFQGPPDSENPPTLTDIHTISSFETRSESALGMFDGIEICSLDRTNGPPYSFWYRFEEEGETLSCHRFELEDGVAVGRFRLFLALGRVDEAEDMVSSENSESIHVSEVALHRFRHLLSSASSLTPDLMSEAKQCLRHLSYGAVSHSNTGVQFLVEASESLRKWPQSEAFAARDLTLQGPVIRDFRRALYAMASTLTMTVRSSSNDHKQVILDEKKQLDSQIAAIGAVEKIISTSECEVRLTQTLLSVASIQDLFRTLVCQGFLDAAERLRRQERAIVTPEVVCLAILEITDPAVDPRNYLPWLRAVVLPSLTINHPLLQELQVWACHRADSFDAENEKTFGLESAILLLECIHDATSKLSTMTHSSLIRFSTAAYRNSESPIHAASPHSPSPRLSNQFSPSSAISTSSRTVAYEPEPNVLETFEIPSYPTIMQLGFVRTQRQPGSAISIQARRVRRHGSAALTVDVQRSSTGLLPLEEGECHTSPGQEADSDCCGCVERKLSNAYHLRMARKLGVDIRVASLRNYNSLGGGEYVVQSMIIHFLSFLGSDTGEARALAADVKEFCRAASVDFDVVASRYANEICSTTMVTPRSLEEGEMLASLCAEPSTKSEIALMILRSALLCPESKISFSDLSSKATKWAPTDTIRAELQEATRLLIVDGIVRHYCGASAPDFFQVSNMRHASRLMSHVCRFIDEPSVLDDALALCSAFTHLSRVQATASIVQRTVFAVPYERHQRGLNETKDRLAQGLSILRRLHDLDPMLARKTASATVDYCVRSLESCARSLRRESPSSGRVQHQAHVACSSACAILKRMGELHPLDHSFHGMLSGQLQRLYQLQDQFSVYLGVSDLSLEVKVAEVSRLILEATIKESNQTLKDRHSALAFALARSKRGCELLYGNDSQMVTLGWQKTVTAVATSTARIGDINGSIELLQVSGLLQSCSLEGASFGVVALAMALCRRAMESAEKCVMPSQSHGFPSELNLRSDTPPAETKDVTHCILRAWSLLQTRGLSSCPRRFLPILASFIETVGHIVSVLHRTDGISMLTLESQPIKADNAVTMARKDSNAPDPVAFLSMPIVHASWYVGDGLLIPPIESLKHCVCLWKLQFSPNGSFPVRSVHHVFKDLSSRGVHTLRLRLQSSFVATAMSSTTDAIGFGDDSVSGFHANTRDLAERSLGGSGSGLTSGIIDSESAVAHLLLLPIKQAFKVFRSCLPSATNRRDFVRVWALADIGVVACGGYDDLAGLGMSTDGKPVARWQNQQTFLSQCRRLSFLARWWRLLQRNDVAFEPKHFPMSKGTEAELCVEEKRRIALLVPQLVGGASKRKKDPTAVLQLTTLFVQAFHLDHGLAAEKHVEFLLVCTVEIVPKDESWKKVESTSHCGLGLTASVTAAKASLQLLRSPSSRSVLLRQCFLSLESNPVATSDYEHLAAVLSLYFEQMSQVLESYGRIPKQDLISLQSELQKVEQRRAALAILSSFFHGNRMKQRPPISDFFKPLSDTSNGETIGVLGRFEESQMAENCFDPLLPLEEVLSSDSSTSTLTALAPLCRALGLPSGYLHARALCVRFITISEGSVIPRFESDILPVINRLESPRDGAKLAEWCAARYPHSKREEKLKCLDVGLTLIIKASEDIERRRIPAEFRDDARLLVLEAEALDAVRRIKAMKSSLSDQLEVETILTSGSYSEASRRALDCLVARLDDCPGDDFRGPEQLLEGLLKEGSALAAEASLDETTLFSVEDFRSIAEVVHQACVYLEEQNSLAAVSDCARALVRRWLVHGDDDNEKSLNGKLRLEATSTRRDVGPFSPSSSSGGSPASSTDPSDEDDKTENFLMDLDALVSGQEGWDDDVRDSRGLAHKSEKITADEEFSALMTKGSPREAAEYANCRAGLRIAFVMSFAEKYHGESDDLERDQENMRPGFASVRRSPVDAGRRLQSTTRLGAKKSVRSELVVKHARELLRVVFAESISSLDANSSTKMRLPKTKLFAEKNSSLNFSHYQENDMAKHQKSEQRALTFAMRYRALRAAVVLCPKEALEMVVDEGIFSHIGISCPWTCLSFGCFVASEIEAMGLALPHSDLVKLSTMNFPSYARSLWRHYGHSESRGFRGRLLLLLLELLCVNETIDDVDFVNAIVGAMSSLDIPRTLIRTCELISAHESVWSMNEGSARQLASTLEAALTKAQDLVFRDMSRKQLKSWTDKDCLHTLKRLGRSALQVSWMGRDERPLYSFVEKLCESLKYCESDHLRTRLIQLGADLSTHVHGKEYAVKTVERIAAEEGGETVLARIRTTKAIIALDNEVDKHSRTHVMSVAEPSSSSDCMSDAG